MILTSQEQLPPDTERTKSCTGYTYVFISVHTSYGCTLASQATYKHTYSPIVCVHCNANTTPLIGAPLVVHTRDTVVIHLQVYTYVHIEGMSTYVQVRIMPCMYVHMYLESFPQWRENGYFPRNNNGRRTHFNTEWLQTVHTMYTYVYTLCMISVHTTYDISTHYVHMYTHYV